MPDHRIILVDGSRLLIEMLNRVLNKTKHLDVIRVTDRSDLSALIGQQETAWAIVSLPVDVTDPDWIDAFMLQHPHVRFLTMSADGSMIKMKWLESQEADLTNISLPELIQILKSDPIGS